MKNKIIVRKMLGYSEKIQEYSKGLNYEKFISSSIVIEACVFNLLQIGELISSIDKVFIEDNEQIPWKSIRGLRHKLVHDYEGVNLELVWDIITNDLPDLQFSLKELLKS
jgi:uncharacterized protein with HEPN domain